MPLVAIYPKDGTLFSDNPFFVLDAPWVTAAQKTAARQFESYVQQPENQRKVLEFGFRPGNPAVSVGAPIVAANGVDPAQPHDHPRRARSRGLDQVVGEVGRAAQGGPRAAGHRRVGVDG